MSSIWVESLGHSFEQALDLLTSAIDDCPAELWESSMWPVPEPQPDHQFLGQDWNPVTDPELRTVLAERWVSRRSTPWSVAWHALEVLDYDLNGELGPWTPPIPFAGHPHWRDLTNLSAAWTKEDLLGYVNYCRQQLRDTLANITDEAAATPLPATHRYAGQPHAQIISALVGHTTEHAAQIRQFIAAAGQPL
ncbi:MAG: DinB family protein [bacterium]